MSSKASPTVLPRYTDLESESAPLLTGVDVNDDSKAISGQYEVYQDSTAPFPQRRCARFGWCKRWSKEPECENRRCVRRKKFARIFLIIIGAFFLFHAAKFAYVRHRLNPFTLLLTIVTSIDSLHASSPHPVRGHHGFDDDARVAAEQKDLLPPFPFH
jgi:hypothetical protein